MMTPKPKTETASSQPLQAIADLVETAGQLTPSSVIIPGGTRIEDLRLVEAASDLGIVDRVWLVGEPQRILAAAQEADVTICQDDIIPADTEEAIAQATVKHMASGKVDVILKGNISTTVMNRHMLGMAERATVTLTSLFDAASIAQGRPMLLTDAGFTTVCNFGRLHDMIRNAIDVAQSVMGIPRPRVAVLSANEKQIPSLPSTRLGLELAQRDWPDAVVCGPLSFDLATSSESVDIKGMPNVPHAREVAGQADILVCPGIDAANILYKAITALTKYGLASLAGVTVGFPIPYVILSRSDTLETRLNSVALSCVYAQRRKTNQQQQAKKSHAAKHDPVHRILTVNPEGAVVKVAVFDNDRCVYEAEVPSPTPYEQMKRRICEGLDTHGIKEIHAVSGCAELLTPSGTALEFGTYRGVDPKDGSPVMTEPVLTALPLPSGGEPMSDLGVRMAAALAQHFQIPGFMVNAAAVPGIPPLTELNTAQALSIRMAGERAAHSVGRDLQDIHLVIAHLGHEMAIASVCRGTCVDVMEPRIAPCDPQDQEAVAAMVFQISKGIGAAFVAAGCDVEAIVLTGHLMRNSKIRSAVRKHVARLAPVLVLEKALDMAYLAQGASDVLAGRTQAKYDPVKE
jgi:phosphate butyryltransferase